MTTLKNGRGIEGEERVGFGFRMIQLVVLAARRPHVYRLDLRVSCSRSPGLRRPEAHKGRGLSRTKETDRAPGATAAALSRQEAEHLHAARTLAMQDTTAHPAPNSLPHSWAFTHLPLLTLEAFRRKVHFAKARSISDDVVRLDDDRGRCRRHY
jgi:hypothetical protein